MWHRVFGTSDVEPTPAALLAHLADLGFVATGHFHGDDAGWFRAAINVAGAVFSVERFLAAEEGIRAELNSWAAHLETCPITPHQAALMEQMIRTRQLITLDSTLAEDVNLALAQYLAQVTDGVYQIDGQGFFSPDGALLVPES